MTNIWKHTVYNKIFNVFLDNDASPKIPDKFKIDAFLVLIDISKERLEKQPLHQEKMH